MKFIIPLLFLTTSLFSQSYYKYTKMVDVDSSSTVTTGEFNLMIDKSHFRMTYNSVLVLNTHATLFGKSDTTTLYLVTPNVFIIKTPSTLSLIDYEFNHKRIWKN